MIAKRPRAKRTALGPYALGALQPARVFEPKEPEEVAATLRDAAAASEAVVVHGGGTLQGASNAPSRYDVALSTKRLTALYDYDARDLTAGAGAGMTIAALARTLAEHGQFLPLDAPLASYATLGGALTPSGVATPPLPC